MSEENPKCPDCGTEMKRASVKQLASEVPGTPGDKLMWKCPNPDCPYATPPLAKGNIVLYKSLPTGTVHRGRIVDIQMTEAGEVNLTIERIPN